MRSLRSACRVSRQLLRPSVSLTRPIAIVPPYGLYHARRKFHSSPVPWAVKSQILKDVGEGITEVQIIQWYVEEGGRIEEWKPLCQYQSDKAVDDITSRYDGVIKKLHFQADDTVPTGKALCDIEVDDAKYPDSNASPKVSAPAPGTTPEPQPDPVQSATPGIIEEHVTTEPTEPPKSKHASLATPAVRGLLKELKVDIQAVTGTGKDGRVLKEDVHRYAAARDSQGAVPSQPHPTTRLGLTIETPQTETLTPLTPVQSSMFKTMTKSLSIPHFLYADELNVASLTAMRHRLASHPSQEQKLSFLPFIVKAVSLALTDYPLLNSRVDTTTNPDKPSLIMRSNHNVGIAMDTPTGLLVPNIKNVQARSIVDIAAELGRLSQVARAGKLTPIDLSGGTITVSNIGSIGGTYVAPVIVPSEVAILGVGKSRVVPVFDEAGNVAKGEKVNFSWSADHRVVDGATMARMAEKVREYLESPEMMLLSLR